MVVVNLATSPLLQRATRQRVAETVFQETIQMNTVRYLPEGWIGVVTNGRGSATNQGIATAQDWWHNATIYSLDTPGYFCDGTCRGNVPGAGISYNCSSTTQSLDLFTDIGAVIFSINTTLSQNSTGAPFLLLTTLYSSAIDDNCTATLTIDNCKIEAGVVEYPVIIQNSTVTLDTNKLDGVSALSTYVYPGDWPTVTNAPVGTLRGLQFVFGFYLFANSSVRTPTDYINGVANLNADMFYKPEPASYDDFTFNNCALKWSSPTNFVLNSMQNFMFRAALRAADGTEVQKFTIQRTKVALLFHSVYGYLAAASVISLLGLFCLLFMLQGWRRLKRVVSLCPLETAKAFCAPLMDLAGYNITADGILGEIGSVLVKYNGTTMIYPDNKDVEQSAKEEGQTVEVVQVRAGCNDGD